MIVKLKNDSNYGDMENFDFSLTLTATVNGKCVMISGKQLTDGGALNLNDSPEGFDEDYDYAFLPSSYQIVGDKL